MDLLPHEAAVFTGFIPANPYSYPRLLEEFELPEIEELNKLYGSNALFIYKKIMLTICKKLSEHFCCSEEYEKKLKMYFLDGSIGFDY